MKINIYKCRGLLKMRKNYILLILSLFITQGTWGQKTSSRTDFDTIKVYSDRVLVDFKTFTDSNLIEQGQAFLYPKSLVIRKSKWLPRFFKTTVQADSLVLHGIVQSYVKNGKYRVGRYENGQKIDMKYYDERGNEIDYQEFYRGLRDYWATEEGTNRYIIHGTKKAKK